MVKKFRKFFVKKNVDNDYKNEKYKKRVSKTIKHIGKKTIFKTNNIIQRRTFGLLTILVKLGVHKKILSIKLAIIFIPLITMLLLDNFMIAIATATFNIFMCAIAFSFTNISKQDATINGVFDYGFYKKKKAYREVAIIVFTTLIMMLSIIFGHYVLNKVLIKIFI